ncbi:MAG: hypothetical protein HY534_01805 [Chloroflexi bacterium]|nr:hypothetical protein [Chloroflexota bacterium]
MGFTPAVPRAVVCLLVALVMATPGCAPDGVTAAEQDGASFEIVAPREGSVLGNGDLFLIEGTAPRDDDGTIDPVEVAFDFEEQWVPAERSSSEPGRWRYLWADPTPGRHRIRARVQARNEESISELSVSVEVRDVWSTGFAIDSPHGGPGSYYKGQLHLHSTRSFDGWTSLPPAQLAAEYKRRGYSFLAITDHDVVTYAVEAQDDRFLMIPAYESTSESGHVTGLWISEAADPLLAPQPRLDHITAQGGMAMLNHPGWRVGWSGADFRTLKGYFGFEVYNGMTTTDLRAERNLGLWHEVLNAKGWANRVWAVAVDDAHDVGAIDRGWIQLKAPNLGHRAIREALESGSFYASSGPTFSVLGVLDGAITAASPEAATIRFIDQDLRTVGEGPGAGASYRPRGTERWVRVEAVQSDGRTAWSQPFWLLFNGSPATADASVTVG